MSTTDGGGALADAPAKNVSFFYVLPKSTIIVSIFFTRLDRDPPISRVTVQH